MIAGGAFCTSAGGPKGLKAFGTGPSAGKGDCAHKSGDGTNASHHRHKNAERGTSGAFLCPSACDCYVAIPLAPFLACNLNRLFAKY